MMAHDVLRSQRKVFGPKAKPLRRVIPRGLSDFGKLRQIVGVCRFRQSNFERIHDASTLVRLTDPRFSGVARDAEW